MDSVIGKRGNFEKDTAYLNGKQRHAGNMFSLQRDKSAGAVARYAGYIGETLGKRTFRSIFKQ